MQSSSARRERSRSSALESLGINVIVLRAHKRFSQTDLAKRSGVSRVTISRIERGEGDPRLGVLSAIANALGATVAELLIVRPEQVVDDAEIARRAKDGLEGSVDAWDLLAAVEEAGGGNPERYSKRGRPRVER